MRATTFNPFTLASAEADLVSHPTAPAQPWTNIGAIEHRWELLAATGVRFWTGLFRAYFRVLRAGQGRRLPGIPGADFTGKPLVGMFAHMGGSQKRSFVNARRLSAGILTFCFLRHPGPHNLIVIPLRQTVPPLATGVRNRTEIAVISARWVTAQTRFWARISLERRSQRMTAFGSQAVIRPRSAQCLLRADIQA